MNILTQSIIFSLSNINYQVSKGGEGVAQLLERAVSSQEVQGPTSHHNVLFPNGLAVVKECDYL